jgi:hypothetical protein
VLCGVAMDVFADALAEHMCPMQVAVGCSASAERMAYGVRATLEARSHWCCLQVDAKNAFNEWYSALVVPELAGSKQLRRLVPLVCALGGPEAPLAFGWQPGKLSPKELEERLGAKRRGTSVPNGQSNGCIGPNGSNGHRASGCDSSDTHEGGRGGRAADVAGAGSGNRATAPDGSGGSNGPDGANGSNGCDMGGDNGGDPVGTGRGSDDAGGTASTGAIDTGGIDAGTGGESNGHTGGGGRGSESRAHSNSRGGSSGDGATGTAHRPGAYPGDDEHARDESPHSPHGEREGDGMLGATTDEGEGWAQFRSVFGWQQGCPGGPAFYCAFLLPTMRWLKQEHERAPAGQGRRGWDGGGGGDHRGGGARATEAE